MVFIRSVVAALRISYLLKGWPVIVLIELCTGNKLWQEQSSIYNFADVVR